MRIVQSCGAHELELQLVHETPTELTFQRGIIPLSTALNNAKNQLIPGVIYMLIWSGFFYFLLNGITGGITNYKQMPILGIILFFVAWFLLVVGVPIAALIYQSYRPCFLVWTFDRNNKQLLKITTNLLEKRYIYKFNFSDIKAIQVEQNYEDFQTFECSELYIKLTSNKEITLSQSSYERDDRQKAIARKYHQEIAKKIRNFVRLTNDSIALNCKDEEV